MELSGDLVANMTNLIFGAGSSIDLKTDWRYGHEWGIPFEDIGAMVDSRLRLRCILPLPGPQDVTPSFNPIDDLDEIINNFQDFGWEVKIADSGVGIVTSLVVDDENVIYSEKLNTPRYFCHSSKPEHISHYNSQFENYWQRALDTNEFQTLYRSKIIESSEQINSVIIPLGTQWDSLIRFFAQNPEQMRSMPPREFEELVAELLIREGMKVELTPATRDGGKDILAVNETPVGPQLYLIECKRHAERNPVGVSIVRSLYGTIEREKASSGLIVTTSRFTDDAIKFAKSVPYRMGMKDFDGLTGWLRKYIDS